jgi:hypothetical protein
MKHSRAAAAVLAVLLLTGFGNRAALCQSQDSPNPEKLDLTAAQRSVIYAAVSKDHSKVAPVPFPVAVGGDVPPMIELYSLPDEAVASNAAAKFYEYTMVQNEVVLVDPTKMRIVATIDPPP